MLTDVTTMPITDPAITDSATDTDTYSTITDPTIPPMPPSPKAEPFHPATTVPASATAPTPRERAYTLHLQGYRSPAIAAHLHVPERTIRHWIQQINQDLNALPALDTLDTCTDADQQEQQASVSPDPAQSIQSTPAMSLTTLQYQRTLAIERHRARSAAAWALHDQLSASLTPLLARVSERLLLHTQYPDDNDNVSMSTLALAGGPLTPAFRAMYQLLPGLINGLTRSLALAERADLQIDRLQGITPPATPPATQPKTPQPKLTSKQAIQEETTPWPTREEIERAVQAERDAEDAIAASVFTERQLNIFRALACLPEKLPEGPIETWNIKIDPNAPISAWRLALNHRHRADRIDRADPDDVPASVPTSATRRNAARTPHRAPTSGTTDTPANVPTTSTGNPSGNAGKKIGNASGNVSGNHSGRHPTSTSPHSNLRRQVLRRAAPSGAVSTAGSLPGNQHPKIGNPGNKSGNPSDNPTAPPDTHLA